jgi:hypothetical protein
VPIRSTPRGTSRISRPRLKSPPILFDTGSAMTHTRRFLSLLALATVAGVALSLFVVYV